MIAGLLIEFACSLVSLHWPASFLSLASSSPPIRLSSLLKTSHPWSACFCMWVVPPAVCVCWNSVMGVFYGNCMPYFNFFSLLFSLWFCHGDVPWLISYTCGWLCGVVLLFLHVCLSLPVIHISAPFQQLHSRYIFCIHHQIQMRKSYAGCRFMPISSGLLEWAIMHSNSKYSLENISVHFKIKLDPKIFVCQRGDVKWRMAAPVLVRFNKQAWSINTTLPKFCTVPVCVCACLAAVLTHRGSSWHGNWYWG